MTPKMTSESKHKNILDLYFRLLMSYLDFEDKDNCIESSRRGGDVGILTVQFGPHPNIAVFVVYQLDSSGPVE